jgi:hypothetical protein
MFFAERRSFAEWRNMTVPFDQLDPFALIAFARNRAYSGAQP